MSDDYLDDSDDEPAEVGPGEMTDSGYSAELAATRDVRTLRDQLALHPEAWVSFRSDHSVKLAGSYSNHVTPEAVYAMPTDWVLKLAERYVITPVAERKDSWFHLLGYTRRPCAVLFNCNGRVVSTRQGYNQFDDDFERLHAYVKSNHPRALDRVENWRPKRVYDENMGPRALFWMTEAATDVIVGSHRYRDFNHHPRKPAVWRELMQAIGIDAFEDRNNFMTGDCSHQIAVFNPESIKIVSAFDNPAKAPSETLDENLEAGATFSI